MAQQLEHFNHQYQITTRFSDVDMLGHVNNATYLTYLEEARIQYARDVLQWGGEADALGMIVARSVVDYLLPLPAGVKVDVYTRCARIGRKSFDLDYFMVLPDQDAMVASAVTTMVAYDYAANTSILFPDAWRTRIINFETHPPEQK